VEYRYTNGGVKLVIDDNVVNKLSSFSQLFTGDVESGGLLLGRTQINGLTKVYDITEPLERDKRGRFLFKRKDKGHLELVSQANERCLYFKGNWHSHPQKNPSPSWRDKVSWKRAMRESKPGNSDYIFFLIVGTKEIKAWCGKLNNRKIYEMELQS